jgi:ribosomal protein S18 acetylase RimI-like enzyme
MTAALEIRPATRDDLAASASLAFAESGGEPEAWRDRLGRELDDPGCLLVVATLAGELVGYGRATWFEPPADAPRDVAPRGYYLVGVVVAPAARRRGVGRALTEARLAWIGERARGLVFRRRAQHGLARAPSAARLRGGDALVLVSGGHLRRRRGRPLQG